jgi:hypothetical protein
VTLAVALDLIDECIIHVSDLEPPRLGVFTMISAPYVNYPSLHIDAEVTKYPPENCVGTDTLLRSFLGLDQQSVCDPIKVLRLWWLA